MNEKFSNTLSTAAFWEDSEVDLAAAIGNLENFLCFIWSPICPSDSLFVCLVLKINLKNLWLSNSKVLLDTAKALGRFAVFIRGSSQDDTKPSFHHFQLEFRLSEMFRNSLNLKKWNESVAYFLRFHLFRFFLLKANSVKVENKCDENAEKPKTG